MSEDYPSAMHYVESEPLIRWLIRNTRNCGVWYMSPQLFGYVCKKLPYYLQYVKKELFDRDIDHLSFRGCIITVRRSNFE